MINSLNKLCHHHDSLIVSRLLQGRFTIESSKPGLTKSIKCSSAVEKPYLRPNTIIIIKGSNGIVGICLGIDIASPAVLSR